MKDSVITVKQKKREIIIFLSCFVLAIAVNAWSIFKYSGNWSELFTQVGYTVIITLIIYFILLIIRVFIYLITKLSVRRQR